MSTYERLSRSGTDKDEFGIALEADNRERDLAKWANATIEQREQVITELLRYGGMVAESRGLRDTTPAPRFPETKV